MSRIVCIAASAGGIKPILSIIERVPAHCRSTFLIVQHIGDLISVLPAMIAAAGKLPASHPENGAWIKPGQVYVAPSGFHMRVRNRHISLDQGPKVHFTRPAADPLFISAAKDYGNRVIGIVLSGGDGDGAEGLIAIKRHGGIALVQRPDEAADPSMPRAALATHHPDMCLSAEAIAGYVVTHC